MIASRKMRVKYESWLAILLLILLGHFIAQQLCTLSIDTIIIIVRPDFPFFDCSLLFRILSVCTVIFAFNSSARKLKTSLMRPRGGVDTISPY